MQVSLESFTKHIENSAEVSQGKTFGSNKILEDATPCKLVFYYEVNASANDHQ